MYIFHSFLAVSEVFFLCLSMINFLSFQFTKLRPDSFSVSQGLTELLQCQLLPYLRFHLLQTLMEKA